MKRDDIPHFATLRDDAYDDCLRAGVFIKACIFVVGAVAMACAIGFMAVGWMTAFNAAQIGGF